MVKSAEDRIAKYTAKYDPVVIEMRLVAMKEEALRKSGLAFTSLYAMEFAAQEVMNAQNVITNDRPKYYNFCREIWKMVNAGVGDPALTSAVVEELTPKYEALDCLKATLIALAFGVFSVTVPP